ncbi:MAG: hypothetical protein A3B86_02455 [Candidatus Yanofskybacteria bacterium RIFCSPHIGHO2_02_FULL_38_22b]|uniref:Excinuclease ABC subunit C n=1 Tax=Candidatus Yanofskybacteria bacterium RIFCSPHIGHO2_02_FULL_38_22b TaxID=1802673 RepID=A0A1F8F5Y7_9BACT|nr:MAG: hypothetical protein A3B86_02455 [Candidatus Yanofskybacteria bacterium RIFCSPHIGHO2_02_FULL_38_22b]OGN20308.1 MAG: hypothetical protein A2910_03290 [Candidatus Yanofskybacteria bacterium RIFCSPLOWO2_01_FULL_39_28]
MTPIELSKEIRNLPNNPGIYLFKNSKNKPLYIGKALNLKNRVKYYLKTNDARFKKMISEAHKIDFRETNSEIEALILESQYIKKYKPEFNIVLRDDKQYSSVIFTDDPFQKIFVTHQPQNKLLRDKEQETRKIKNLTWLHGSPSFVSEHIGPFTDAGALKTTLRLLRRIFPYCTCKQQHNNYCLNYHIGKCLGFCCLKKQTANNLQLIIYRKNIKAIKDILSGKRESLIKDFEKKMKNLSNKQDYEKAIELQGKIEKIRRVFKNARIINKNPVMIYHNSSRILNSLQNILNLLSLPHRIECYDIANIQGKHAVGAMAVFINGRSDKNEYRKFKIYTKNTPNDAAMIKEILIRRFNHSEWPKPNLILVDGGKAQLNIAKKISKKIPIIALTKNEKHVGEKILTSAGKMITLSKLPTDIRNLLINLDSEAHNFAISYYRKLHRKSV